MLFRLEEAVSIKPTCIAGLIVCLFGGVGYAGMGKYYGKAGFDALNNTKAMLIGNPDLELDIFPPYAGKDIAKNLSVFS
jgi:aldehyde dehydrogenase (NAD+)